MIPIYRAATTSCALTAGLFVAACQLPNLEPFADATLSVSQGVRETGRVAVARIKGNDEPFDTDNPPAPTDAEFHAWEVYQQWEIRLAAADALR